MPESSNCWGPPAKPGVYPREITVDVQALDLLGFASALCHALAIKLMNDEQLQGELMDMLEAGEQSEKPAE